MLILRKRFVEIIPKAPRKIEGSMDCVEEDLRKE